MNNIIFPDLFNEEEYLRNHVSTMITSLASHSGACWSLRVSLQHLIDEVKATGEYSEEMLQINLGLEDIVAALTTALLKLTAAEISLHSRADQAFEKSDEDPR